MYTAYSVADQVIYNQIYPTIFVVYFISEVPLEFYRRVDLTARLDSKSIKLDWVNFTKDELEVYTK